MLKQFIPQFIASFLFIFIVIGNLLLLMKPFNHRFSEIMKKKNLRFKSESNEKMVFYYRKGRMPTVDNQEHFNKKQSFICLTQSTEGDLVYSNNPHKVQLQVDNLRRSKIHQQMKIIEEKYYKKENSEKVSKSQSYNSKILSPQKKIVQLNTDRKQDENKPIIYRRRSHKLQKQYKVIENWAMNGLKQINEKNRSHSHEQITRQKNLFKGLKGMKYYYALARSIEIPPQYS